MDSIWGWMFMAVASCCGVYALVCAVLAEAKRRYIRSEAEWTRLETEWKR